MQNQDLANTALLHKQVENALRQEIESGIWAVGDRIPSEAQLSEKYGVSRVTVRNAISRLVEDGLLVRLQGKGTFVSSHPIQSNVRVSRSFTAICEMQGRTAGAKLIDLQLCEPNAQQAAFLGLAPGERVLRLKRLRLVDEIPLVVETNYFPESFSFLMREELSGSLYRLLAQKYQITAAQSRMVVGVCRAGAEHVRWLGVAQSAPLLFNRSEVFDQAGTPLHLAEQAVRVDLPEIFQYYV